MRYAHASECLRWLGWGGEKPRRELLRAIAANDTRDYGLRFVT
jgi:hypothetical protein